MQLLFNKFILAAAPFNSSGINIKELEKIISDAIKKITLPTQLRR